MLSVKKEAVSKVRLRRRQKLWTEVNLARGEASWEAAFQVYCAEAERDKQNKTHHPQYLPCCCQKHPVSSFTAPAEFPAPSRRMNLELKYVKHMVQQDTVNKSWPTLLPSAVQQCILLRCIHMDTQRNEKVMEIKTCK